MSLSLDITGQIPAFFPLRPFTVEEYHAMGRAGVLTGDDRVELLQGWIVRKVNHNPKQDSSVDLTGEALRSRLPPGWRIRIQSAITTADSEPEPDVVVVRGAARDFSQRHPGSGEIGLVVEVADSSLQKHRRKRQVYAAAGIKQYWIVNLLDSKVEVYSEPTGAIIAAEYHVEQIFTPGQLVPLLIDSQTLASVPVVDLLP